MLIFFYRLMFFVVFDLICGGCFECVFEEVNGWIFVSIFSSFYLSISQFF